jgi:hypothetical protein
MKPWHLLLPIAAAGCSAAPSAPYFPLDAGHQWTYDVTTQWEREGEPQTTSLVLSTLGRERLTGGDEAWRRRSDSGADYWLRADDSGVWRMAAKSDLDHEPVPDPAPRWVLKAPFAVGTQWQAPTISYLLRRRHEFAREVRRAHPELPMTYTIEAVGEAVQTRAGRFADCLRVRGSGALRLYADRAVGLKDMALTSTEWYCRGVGLVRLVREEPASATFLSGGTLTMELSRWQ